MKIRLEHPRWRRWLLRLVREYLGTCRVEVDISPETRSLMFLSDRPVLYAIWHCHLLYPIYFAHRYFPRLPPLVVMTSPSRDGELIAELSRGLGLLAARGSRRKGGVQALQAMAAYLRQGHRGALIADGSRGPARVAQKGALFLAREAQVPILPLAVAARRKITFNSWDRFELPLPFSRLALLVGDPLWVEPDVRGAALEVCRQQLEDRLNRLFAHSQDYFSR